MARSGRVNIGNAGKLVKGGKQRDPLALDLMRRGAPPQTYDFKTMEPLEQRLAIAGALALAASGLAIYAPPAQAATLEPGSDSTASARNAPVVTALDPDPLDDGPALTGPEQAQAEEQTGGSSVDPREDVPDDAAASNASPSSAGTPGEIAMFVPGPDDSAPAAFVYLSAPPAHTTSDIPWDWDHTTTPFPQLVPPDLGFLPSRATPPATPPRMQQPVPPGGFHGVQHPTGSTSGIHFHPFTSVTAPIAPAGLSGQGTSPNQITLSWQPSGNTVGVFGAPSHSAATAYKVQRAEVTGATASAQGTISSDFADVGTTGALQQNFADTGLSEGTTYAYRIIASNSGGQSGPSDVRQISTQPNAPDNLHVSNVAGTSLTLTWDNHSDALAASTDSNDRFVVEQSSDAWGSFTEATMLQGTDASGHFSGSVTGLTPATTYYFRVKATKAGADSDYSNGQVIVTGPAAPTLLTANGVSSSEIDLSWNELAGQYSNLEQSSDGGASFTQIASLMGGTTYQASVSDSNSAYQFRMRSFNEGVPSDYSPSITGVTAGTLSATLISSGTNFTTGEVDLNWDAGHRLDGYVIERASDTDSGNFQQIGTAQPNVTGFADTDVHPGHDYTYRLVANAGTASAASGEVMVRTAPVVEELSAASTSSEVDLSWTDIGQVDEVVIERSSTDTQPGSFSAIGTSADLNTFADTTIQPGTSYYYFVQASNFDAFNVLQAGDPSNIVIGGSVPQAPELTFAYQISPGDVQINWEPSSEAQSYHVFRAMYSGGSIESDLGSYAEVGTADGSQSSFSDSGLVGGNLYAYRIVATNVIGDSDPSEMVSAQVASGPLTDLSAIAVSPTEIDLSWNVAVGAEVLQYDIWRADGENIPDLSDAPTYTTYGPTPSFADTQAAPGHRYAFVVVASTLGGPVTSDPVLVETVPLAPGSVTGFAASDHEVDVFWGQTPLAGAYLIQRSDDGSEGSFATIACVGGDVASYADVALSGGITYTYRVLGFDQAGPSDPSGTVDILTMPAVPAGLSGNATTNSEVDLQWNAEPGVEFYSIQVSGDAAGPYYQIATVSGDQTAYADAPFAPGEPLYYRVEAFNASGSAGASDFAQVILPPTEATLTAVSAHQVDLTWSGLDASYNYAVQIYRSPDSQDQNFVLIGSVATEQTAYTDTTAPAGVISYYRLVVADTSSPISSPGGPITSVLTVPDAPASLSALYSPAGTQVQWAPSTGADTYTLWSSTYDPGAEGSSFWNSATQVNVGSDTSFVDPNPSPNAYYLVIATNAAGDSVASEPVSVTVPTPETAPTDLHVGAAWPGGIELDWTGGDGGLVHIQLSSVGSDYYDLAVVDGGLHHASVDTSAAPTLTYTFRVYGADYADKNPTAPSNTVLYGAPADPSDLIPTVVSASEIDLAWTGNGDDRSAYVIELSTDAWTTSSTLATVEPNQFTYAAHNLDANTTCYFRVSATTDGFNSQGIAAAALTAPDAVSDLHVTGAGFGTVSLNWTNESTGLWDWKVEYSSDGGVTVLSDTVSGDASGDTLTGLLQGNTYTFWVNAYNGTYSADSNHVTGTNAWAPPTSLTATAISDQEIELTWSAPVGLASQGAEYNIYRSTTDGFTIADATPIATGINDTSYHDTTAQSGTTYYYRVTAASSGGLESDPTAAVHATTPDAHLTSGMPPDLSRTYGQALDGGAVLARFRSDDPNDDASQFTVTIDWGDGQTTAGVVQEDPDNAGWLIVTEAALGSSAHLFAETGSYTANVSVKKPNGAAKLLIGSRVVIIPGSVALTVTPGNAQIALSWTPSDGATRYNIYRTPEPPTGSTIGGAVYDTVTGSTTYTDLGLAPGATYYYAVTGIAGKFEGEQSGVAQATTTPDQPVNLTAVADSAAVHLKWDPVKGATSYTVTQNGPNGAHREIPGVPQAQYDDTQWEKGTTYTYKVAAVNDDIPAHATKSIDSDSVSVVTIPPAPPDVSATRETGAISLRWGEAKGTQTYEIYRTDDTPNGPGWELYVTVSGTARAYKDYRLEPNTNYSYYISPVNAAGRGAPSAAVVALTLPPALLPINATTSYSEGDGTTVQVSWSGIYGIGITYTLYRSTSPASRGDIVIGPTTDTSYPDPHVTDGTTYYYTVTANNQVQLQNGNGPISHTVKITTPGIPAIPTNVQAVSSGTQATISWTRVPGATEYKVYRDPSMDTDPVELFDGLADGFTDYSFDPTGNYTYQVSAANDLGESDKSSPVSATPPPSLIKILSSQIVVVAGGTVDGSLGTVPEGDHYVADESSGALTIDDDGTYHYSAGDTAEWVTIGFHLENDQGDVLSNQASLQIDVTPDQPLRAGSRVFDCDAGDVVIENLGGGEHSMNNFGSNTAPNGDDFSYTLESDPATGNGFVVFQSDGDFKYIPNQGFHGQDTFYYRTHDGGKESNLASVTINVHAAPLLAVNDVYRAVAGETYSGGISAVSNEGVGGNDIGSGAFELLSQPPSGFNFQSNDGTFSYTPASEGRYSFTYRLVRDSVESNIATVVFDVAPAYDGSPDYDPNDYWSKPALFNGHSAGKWPYYYLVEDQTQITVGAGDGLLSAPDAPSGLAISLLAPADIHAEHGDLSVNADGSFTYTPDTNFVGWDLFTFTGTLGEDTEQYSGLIEVRRLNPRADDSWVDVEHGKTAGVDFGPLLLNYFGAADPSLSVDMVEDPQHGSFDHVAGGVWRYTPDGDYTGSDYVTFKTNNGTLDSNYANIFFDVGQATLPNADYRDYLVQPGVPLQVPSESGLITPAALADNPNLAISNPGSLIESTQQGDLQLNADGTFTYTPNADFVGTDWFTYQIEDGSGHDSNYATVTFAASNPAFLAIDSDNDSRYEDAADLNASERSLQKDSSKPGKYVAVNRGDFNGDNIPDWADGFNADGSQDPSADDLPAGALFVPLTVNLGNLDPDSGKFRFVYDASNPQDVELPSSSDPAYHLPSGGGTLRLWDLPNRTSQARQSASLNDDGNFVADGTEYSCSDLGSGTYFTLYIEAVQAGDSEIKLQIDPNGDRNWIDADSVRVSAIDVELRVDSLNALKNAPPSGTEWESQARNWNNAAGERLANDPISDPLPGKYIVVDDHDADHDRVPDFADGFNHDQLSVTDSQKADDKQSNENSHFVPLVIKLPSNVNPARIKFQIDYGDSDPLAQTFSAAGTASDPLFYDSTFVGDGPLRLWTADADKARSLYSFTDPNFGGSGTNASRGYIPPNVGGSSNGWYGPEEWRQLQDAPGGGGAKVIYIEAVAPNVEQQISIRIDPDGTGRAVSFVSDVVKVTPIETQIAIDANNNDGFDGPDGADSERQVQDIRGDITQPGKFIAVDDTDIDHDGIPDFADGYDLDESSATTHDKLDDSISRDDNLADSRITGDGANPLKFVPVIVTLPDGIDLNKAKVRITYADSDPSAVAIHGIGTPEDPYWYGLPASTPPESINLSGRDPDGVDTAAQPSGSGYLRLWTKNADASRKDYSVVNGGDFVPSSDSVPYSGADLHNLGFGQGGSEQYNGSISATFYVEAVKASRHPGDLTISVEVDPDGDGPASFIAVDTARLTAIEADLADDSLNSDPQNTAAPPTTPVALAPRDKVSSNAEKADALSGNGAIFTGKHVAVDNRDLDNDGIPDFADGFNHDHRSATPEQQLDDGLDDSQDVPVNSHFVPVTVTIPGLIDLNKARLQIRYNGSDPALITRTGAGTTADPYVYHLPAQADLNNNNNNNNSQEGGASTVDKGQIRLWTKGTSDARTDRRINTRNLTDPADASLGFYVPPTADNDYYTPSDLQRLGFSSENRTVTFYVEGITPSDNAAGTSIEIRVDPDGDGSANYVATDAVRLTVLDFNLHLDSANVSDGVPARTDYDYDNQIKDDPKRPGKIIVLNDADRNSDGIPDMAQGFSTDGSAATDGAHPYTFVPLVLDIPAWVDPSKAKIRFTYDASDPTQGQLTGTENFAYTPAAGPPGKPGTLRIWTKNAMSARKSNSADNFDGGDFVANNVEYTPDQLHYSAANNGSLTLYIEAVRASKAAGDQEIHVEIDPLGDGHYIAADDARVTAAADTNANAYSGDVRLSDGTVSDTHADLSSSGFGGGGWGLTRTVTDQILFGLNGSYGNGVEIAELPHLLQGTSTIIEIVGGNAAYFDSDRLSTLDPDAFSSNSSEDHQTPATPIYTARFGSRDKLQYFPGRDASGADGSEPIPDEYILTDDAGDQYHFNGFSTDLPFFQRGQLAKFVDPAGNETTVDYNSDGTVQEIHRGEGAESYAFGYNAEGDAKGLLNEAILRRRVGGGWDQVRQAGYGYYGPSDSNGNNRDLQYASVYDGADNFLGETYYRYAAKTDSSPTNPAEVSRLTYVLDPENFARLSGGDDTWDPNSADQSKFTKYADKSFTYYAGGSSSYQNGKVSQQILQGDGPTLNDLSAQGSIHYNYESNSSLGGSATGINAWQSKVQIQQSGTADETIFTNFAGESMLDSQAINGHFDNSFTQYDTQGRPILSAAPSAVSIDAPTGLPNDLLNLSNGRYAGLRNASGLISVTHYEPASGATAGLVHEIDIKRGENGTEIPQARYDYAGQEVEDTAANGDADNFTVTVLAAQSSFVESDPSAPNTNLRAVTTGYAYPAWQRGQFLTRQTTLPDVSSQNGVGGSSLQQSFDAYGQQTSFTDADGFLHTTQYDNATGAVTGTTTAVGDGTVLSTQTKVDDLGRPLQATDPMGNVSTYTYADMAKASAVRIDPAAGPSHVAINDRTTGEMLSLTLSPAAGSANQRSGYVLQSLTRTRTDLAGRAVFSDRYFDTSGVGLPGSLSIAAGMPTLPSGGWGAVNQSYYETAFQYDSAGRQSYTRDAVGTIRQTTYDELGRPTQVQIGTSAGLTPVTVNQYDSGGVGDSTLTQVTQHAGGSLGDRITQMRYDWRDRLIVSQTTGANTPHPPVTFYRLDNRGEQTGLFVFDGASLAIDDIDPNQAAPLDSSALRARTRTLYDDRGRAFRSIVTARDPAQGTAFDASGVPLTYTTGSSLTTNIYHDGRGEVIATSNPGGLWNKTFYDGAGRATDQFVTDGIGGVAASVTDDHVLTQAHTSFDPESNPFLIVTSDRFHNTAATGPLTPGDSRVSSVQNWYDAANRLVATGNFGTKAAPGPNTVAIRGTDVLLTEYNYDDAARTLILTDPRGIKTKLQYDVLGRVSKRTDAYNPGVGEDPWQNFSHREDVFNRITEIQYDGLDRQTRVTTREPTVNAGEGVKTTEYLYQDSVGNAIHTKDLLTTVKYPSDEQGHDGRTLASEETRAYDALGEVTKDVDRYGVTHLYTYDADGRQVREFVSPPLNNPTAGTVGHVDMTVNAHQTTYDSLGRAITLTSVAGASAGGGGYAKNQIQYVYNGFGQVTDEYQEHYGTVRTAPQGGLLTSAEVRYVYDSSSNDSRLVSESLRNNDVQQQTLQYQYSDAPNDPIAGLDDHISRVSGIAADNGTGLSTVEQYRYLGLSTVVVRSHPLSHVDLSYVGTGPDNPYPGFDQFGRVVDQHWSGPNNTTVDDIRTSYDADSNVVSSSSNEANQTYTYDEFNRVIHFESDQSGGETLGWIYGSDGNPVLSSASYRSPDVVNNRNGVWFYLNDNVHSSTVIRYIRSLATFDLSGSPTLHSDALDPWGDLTEEKSNREYFDQGNATLHTVETDSNDSYDALGRATIEALPGAFQHDIFYDLQGNVLFDGQSRYVWSTALPQTLVLSDSAASGRLYALQDAQGSTAALWQSTDQNGAAQNKIIGRFAYDPFGAPETESVSTPKATWTNIVPEFRYLFHEQSWNPYARVYTTANYDPYQERSIVPDPAAYAAGQNAFFDSSYNGHSEAYNSSNVEWYQHVLSAPGAMVTFGMSYQSWFIDGADVGRKVLGVVAQAASFTPLAPFAIPLSIALNGADRYAAGDSWEQVAAGVAINTAMVYGPAALIKGAQYLPGLVSDLIGGAQAMVAEARAARALANGELTARFAYQIDPTVGLDQVEANVLALEARYRATGGIINDDAAVAGQRGIAPDPNAPGGYRYVDGVFRAREAWGYSQDRIYLYDGALQDDSVKAEEILHWEQIEELRAQAVDVAAVYKSQAWIDRLEADIPRRMARLGWIVAP